MITYQRITHSGAVFGALLLSSSLAFSQGVQPPGGAPQAEAEEEDEEVIVLSPFEVTTEDDTGYVASETLAGTRIRTELRDVGSAISVVTREFITDIGATDNSTLLQYTTNAEVAGTRGIFAGLGNGASLDETNNLRAPAGAQRLRGLAAADNTRDFFVTDIPWDSYNVDRVDIQRGANSILFGLGSPAGIVNASLRNAGFTTAGVVEGRFGSYGSWRASLDYNQVLAEDELAIRVAGLMDREQFRQEPAYEDDERVYLALRYDPRLFDREGWRTSIKVKYENGDIEANRPRILPPNDSLTPWFRPDDPTSLWGGMGKTAVTNGYDAFRSDVENFTPDVPGLGLQTSESPNYEPWLASQVNQQQPFYLLDGATGQTYRVIGGYINPGARNPDGSTRGAAQGISGKRYGDQFFGLTSLPTYANNADLPLADSGQYRTASLQDESVFDFYDILIDGPTKREFENWDAYNIDLSQTMMDERLAVQFTYDRQKYERGGEAFLGGSPTLNIDIMQNYLDYYLSGADGRTSITNPNFGRPYVTSTAGGSGSSYESDREYFRASVYGELRARDFSDSDFFRKLFGRHRFTGVFSKEEFFTENREWVENATSREWAAYWNGNDGSGSSFRDRPPVAFVYLGSSIADRDTAAGANLPGISSSLMIPDSNVYVFDSNWTNFGVGFDEPWTIPEALQIIYPPDEPPTGQTEWLQNSNPANYTGWNTNFYLDLLRYNNGQDQSLLTNAQMSERETESWVFSWQGYLWNEAIIPTIGWRHDEVKSRGVTAPSLPLNRSILNLQPDVYRLPDEFPEDQEFEDDSTTYGLVVHLNRLFEDDPLPLNVSLTYSKSSNFQVTDVRRDLYGNPIENPTGETEDYGVLLSTKDGNYSFRALRYETEVQAANSELSDAAGIGRVIQQGLRFRNVFLYDLAVYDWGSRESPQSRNTWGGPENAADTTLTPEEGRALEDAAITTWNEIQAWLTERNFFQAWGFQPVALDKLTDRSTYEATLTQPNPNLPPVPSEEFMPDPATVFAYVATPPQGFTVTADTVSKGYEFEFTANPLPNWRIAINASKTEAVRNNVGGPLLEEFVTFLDEQLTDTPAGNMPQFGNTSLSIYANVYGPWRGNYTLMKLQEGSAAPEIREWRYNIVTNYTFRSGFLRNVGIGASYRWRDEVIIGYPVIPQENTFTFDLDSPYHGPSEDALDLWVSYGRPITDDIDWRIQLNVRNVLADSDGVIPISVQPDGTTWASVRIMPATEWFVTNTFSF